MQIAFSTKSKLISMFAAAFIFSCASLVQAEDPKAETPQLELKVDTSPSLVPDKPKVEAEKAAAAKSTKPTEATKSTKSTATKAPAKVATPVKAKTPKKPAKTKLGAVTPINDFELGRYQYCGADADCVIANNGCCDCANGGKDVAVNKERLADFQKRFDCLYSKCGLKTADPVCGSGVVSCVMHKCQYFPPGEGVEDRF